MSRLAIVAFAALVGLTHGTATAVGYVGGVFSVSGLPGVTAMSVSQFGTALHLCLSNGTDTVNVADGTVDLATGAFTLSYLPASLGPGGLGAYCSIDVSGTFAPDGSSFTATQVERSTCVPPPFSCVPGCVVSATIAFAGMRSSTTPAPCCGDQLITAGEQCDDGNDNAGDCCAADCTPEPAGQPCPDDGDVCTSEQCSGFGACHHENSCVYQGLQGKKLILKRVGSREKLLWLAKDPDFVVPTPGGSDDPSTAGARLELFAPLEASVSMSIPPGAGNPGWTVTQGTTDRYKYRNAPAPLGGSPVRVAVLKDGKTLKVVAKDAGFPLTQSLFGVGIRLVTGSLATCSYFPIGTTVVDVPGRFEARDGLDPVVCDRGSLGVGSPVGAFVD